MPGKKLPIFLCDLRKIFALLPCFSQLKWLEENNDGKNTRLLRSAAMETVSRYSSPNGPFYNDERIFAVFRIVVLFKSAFEPCIYLFILILVH